jgi:predicted nucleic acid-binding protein
MAELAWMLDTNTLSELIRNPRGPLLDRLAEVVPDALCTSIVVACELCFGALTLVTHNLREIQRVPGLRVQSRLVSAG